MELAKLWTLAGRALMAELQNQVMWLLQQGVCTADDSTVKALLQHAYEGHESNSLKKVAIKEVYRCISNESFDYWTKDMPESALLDLTRVLVARPSLQPQVSRRVKSN
jgi:hypothetical protein